MSEPLTAAVLCSEKGERAALLQSLLIGLPSQQCLKLLTSSERFIYNLLKKCTEFKDYFEQASEHLPTFQDCKGGKKTLPAVIEAEMDVF